MYSRIDLDMRATCFNVHWVYHIVHLAIVCPCGPRHMDLLLKALIKFIKVHLFSIIIIIVFYFYFVLEKMASVSRKKATKTQGCHYIANHHNLHTQTLDRH